MKKEKYANDFLEEISNIIIGKKNKKPKSTKKQKIIHNFNNTYCKK